MKILLLSHLNPNFEVSRLMTQTKTQIMPIFFHEKIRSRVRSTICNSTQILRDKTISSPNMRSSLWNSWKREIIQKTAKDKKLLARLRRLSNEMTGILSANELKNFMIKKSLISWEVTIRIKRDLQSTNPNLFQSRQLLNSVSPPRFVHTREQLI